MGGREKQLTKGTELEMERLLGWSVEVVSAVRLLLVALLLFVSSLPSRMVIPRVHQCGRILFQRGHVLRVRGCEPISTMCSMVGVVTVGMESVV